MSRSVNAIVVAVAIFVVLAGSIFYFAVLRDPSDIEVRLAGSGWQASGNGTAAWFAVELKNTLDLDVELQGYEARLEVNGERVAANESRGNATLAAGQSETLRFVFDVPAEAVSGWLRGHVEDDESSEAALVATLSFEGPEGPVDVDFDESWDWSTEVADAVSGISSCSGSASGLCVEDVEASWDVRGQTTWLTTTWTVRNPSDEDAVFGPGQAHVAWAGVEVAKGEVPRTEIGSGDSEDVHIDFAFDHEALVEWWPKHVDSCERSGATVGVTASWNASEPEEEEEDPEPSNNSTGTGTGSGTGNNSTGGNGTGNNSTLAALPIEDLRAFLPAPWQMEPTQPTASLRDEQQEPEEGGAGSEFAEEFEAGDVVTGLACRGD